MLIKFCNYFVTSEIQKMQCLARDHSRRIFEENERLRSQLDAKRKELDQRCKQLDKLVAQNDMEKNKLDVEKQKVTVLFSFNLPGIPFSKIQKLPTKATVKCCSILTL